MSRTARCSCGALTASANGDPAAVIACHCTECQRRTGAAFGVGAYFPAAQVTMAGAAKTFRRDCPEGRQIANFFCPNCGTTVYWTADLQPGVIGIAAGAFNDPDFPDPTHSIWEKSQLRWVTMRPDIPGHIEGRASAKSR